MTDHARDIESIFLKALECPSAAAREDYLKRTCDGQPEPERRIRELLQAHDHASGPLDAPALPLVASTVSHSHAEEVGRQIGPYKVLHG